MTEQQGHQQVAALPWRRRKDGALEVLLITSRETKRWVIPKGWPMEGLKDYNAARREAFEEAGVEGQMNKVSLGSYTYGKRQKAGVTRALNVEVYALEVSTLLPRWPEKAERRRKWFPAEIAAQLVHEPQLRDLILQFDEGED